MDTITYQSQSHKDSHKDITKLVSNTYFIDHKLFYQPQNQAFIHCKKLPTHSYPINWSQLFFIQLNATPTHFSSPSWSSSKQSSSPPQINISSPSQPKTLASPKPLPPLYHHLQHTIPKPPKFENQKLIKILNGVTTIYLIGLAAIVFPSIAILICL